MLTRFLFKVSMAAALTCSGIAAHAQEAVQLEGDVKVVRTIEEGANPVERLEAPDKVVPGDRLVFSTTYRNASDDVVENFVVTNPLPGAVALAAEGDFEVSVDGGQTFGALAALQVSGETGSRPAELADVTHIRLVLQTLAPNSSGTLSYNAVVR